jgi:Ca2+-binding EF-hand superfamily protein
MNGDIMDANATDRLKKRFEMLDADSTGYLEQKDFTELASRVVRALGQSEQDPKAQALVEGYQQYWNDLFGTLDANADGRISLDEFLSAGRAPNHFADNGSSFAHGLANLADVNDDGFVEGPDLVSCLTAIGFAPDDANTFLGLLDTAGDGRVPTADWAKAIENYYTSESADVAARVLIGQR